jgi:hypothetical protein
MPDGNLMMNCGGFGFHGWYFDVRYSSNGTPWIIGGAYSHGLTDREARECQEAKMEAVVSLPRKTPSEIESAANYYALARELAETKAALEKANAKLSARGYPVLSEADVAKARALMARATPTRAASPAPKRIGRTEREACVDALSAHYQDERINGDEFGERMGEAFAAQHQSDLDALLADLPAIRVNQNVNAGQYPIASTEDVARAHRRLRLSSLAGALLVATSTSAAVAALAFLITLVLR